MTATPVADAIAELKPPSRFARLKTYSAHLWGRREFAWYMAMGNLRSQHNSTSLGVLWYILNPILLAAVYFFVFGFIFAGSQRGSSTFLAYLVSGMFVFQFTRSSLTSGAASILMNGKLLKNIDFPRLVLPISSVIESSVGFIASLGVFFLIITPITREIPGWNFFLVVPIFFIQVVANIGLAALLARLTVPFRDVKQFIPYLTRIWLYLSPIIWTLDRLDTAPDWVTTVVHLNPMFYFLRIYRAALTNTLFVPSDFIVTGVFALVVLVVGIAAFVRFEGKLVQYL